MAWWEWPKEDRIYDPRRLAKRAAGELAELIPAVQVPAVLVFPAMASAAGFTPLTRLACG